MICVSGRKWIAGSFVCIVYFVRIFELYSPSAGTFHLPPPYSHSRNCFCQGHMSLQAKHSSSGKHLRTHHPLPLKSISPPKTSHPNNLQTSPWNHSPTSTSFTLGTVTFPPPASAGGNCKPVRNKLLSSSIPSGPKMAVTRVDCSRSLVARERDVFVVVPGFGVAFDLVDFVAVVVSLLLFIVGERKDGVRARDCLRRWRR